MSLWRHGDFLRLWSAQTISQFGSQITMLALPLVALLVLDVSAFQFAVLATVEWLPWLLFSLPVGAWVDRVHRRPVLVLADLARGAALLSIPIAYWLDALTLGQLYVVGFATGVLTAEDDSPVRIWEEEEVMMVRTVADHLAVGISNARLFRQVEEQAITDELTGLYNRRYLQKCLEREVQFAQRSGQTLSLVLFDLDYLKRINDSFGHIVGDLDFKSVAEKAEALTPVPGGVGPITDVWLLRNTAEAAELRAGIGRR